MADRPPVTVSFAQFGALARRIADQAHGLGLVAPSFRTPPRVDGVDRTLRRRADGTGVVAVRIQGRSPAAVVADLVEGVLAVNRLGGDEATRVRTALLAGVNLGRPRRVA
jgi:hypothetical protein